MSTDPQAKLYYGFPLPEEFAEREDDDSYELNDAWEESHRPKQPVDKSDYGSPEWDEWRKAYDEWRKGPQNIQIDWSGSEGCEAYYLSAEGMKLSVEWNEQIKLPEFLVVHPETKDWMRKFCEQHKIEWQEPAWYLAAKYW